MRRGDRLQRPHLSQHRTHTCACALARTCSDALHTCAPHLLPCICGDSLSPWRRCRLVHARVHARMAAAVLAFVYSRAPIRYRPRSGERERERDVWPYGRRRGPALKLVVSHRQDSIVAELDIRLIGASLGMAARASPSISAERARQPERIQQASIALVSPYIV